MFHVILKNIYYFLRIWLLLIVFGLDIFLLFHVSFSYRNVNAVITLYIFIVVFFQFNF